MTLKLPAAAAALVALFSLALGACGSSDSSGSGGAAGSGTGGSSSMMNCSTASGCMNGACKCSAGDNKDKACCGASSPMGCSDPSCDTLCKVCM